MLHVKQIVGILAALACTAAPGTAQTVGAATIRGVVLDRAGGRPLADVSVQERDAGIAAATDAQGRFELRDVPPGSRTLHVSTVGFILVKRSVDVGPGETADVTVALSEGTGTYTDTVTVSTDPFREREAGVPAQQMLGSADIQNLRSLLTNDPMRAVQTLPGVTSGDDFHGEFAVRGSRFDQMNVTLDGIATPFLLHTVQQVQDGGSTAMVNGDILGGISLLSGSYPQRLGNRLGAELAFEIREGSRVRRQVRAGVSSTDAALVGEGPFAHGSGSWLLSARRSYLDTLLKRIDRSNDFGFGFADVQSKIVYEPSPAHRLELTLVGGRSRLDRDVQPGNVNEAKDARNRSAFVNVGWRLIASPSTVVTQRMAFAGNDFANAGPTGFVLDGGAGRDLTWRADIVRMAGRTTTIEGGGQVQWQQREHTAGRFFGSPYQARNLQAYDETARLSSAYALLRWAPGTRIMLSPGARVDAWSLTRDTAISPWLQGEARLGRSVKIQGGAGIHHQFADFEAAAGSRAGSRLAAERAYHADLGVEQKLSETARWRLTFYNREERDVLRLPDDEVRLVANRLAGRSLTSRWANALDGYARGVELLVQRRNAAGLSGWASYSFGINRYHDRFTGETFDGDVDQRHTLNVYASYRLSSRSSIGGKLRSGSNTPAPGYWTRRGQDYYVASTRNTVRIPAYIRLDLRGSRTFDWQGGRLTVFAELLNAAGRQNVRFNAPGVNMRTGQADEMFESMIPRVPSVGILLEF